MQLIISSVRGNTLLFQSPDSFLVKDLKLRLQDVEGIPSEHLRVIHASRDLNDALPLKSCISDNNHILHVEVRMRLAGGKGGFGSLLRGGPQGVTLRKTTNFDACRDLTGRRLRHVRNETRLADWIPKESERQYEKIALKYIRSSFGSGEKSANNSTSKDEETQLDHEQLDESISSGIQKGLLQILKRKYEDEEDEDEEEEEEEDEEEEEEEVDEEEKEEDEQEKTDKKQDGEKEQKQQNTHEEDEIETKKKDKNVNSKKQKLEKD